MFNSRKTKLSNADNIAGQSLFDFLKRKKKVSLQQSIRGSRRQQNDMSISNINVKQEEPGETTRNQTYRKTVSSNITPKKVTFVQSEQKKQTARTFIDMISPLKQRPKNYPIEQTSDIAQVSQRKGIFRSSNKKSQPQQYSRKQLNSSISILKQTLQQLIKVGKTLKQKSHSLFIDMKPVFKVTEDNAGENKIIRRKIEDAKDKLRIMEHQFTLLDIQNANQIIESFHKTLAEHLISVEAKNKANFERNQMDTFMKLKAQKDSKIAQLMAQNKSLSHNCNVLQKKAEKLENLLAETKEKEQQKFENYHCTNQSKFARLEARIKQLEQRNQVLEQTAAEHEKQKLQWSKKIKDAVYGKQVAERKLVEQHDKAKSARQQFLLNQIMMLKQQFQGDISQLTNLYSAKDQQNQLTISEQNRQIKQLKVLLEENRERQKKIGTDSQSLKNVVNKYKKQNECLVTDMHRMNEQLYQHWLALKDIKTLANRLQIMPKFSRIFEDLAFNDLLFS